MPELERAGPVSVIADLARWLSQGQRAWLATVVATWGSSPRPQGAWLAISDRGEWSGSVSGGCLEESLLRQGASDCPDRPWLLDYGIREPDRTRFRLPCGGHIRLLVEPLSPTGDLGHVQALLTALHERRPVLRAVSLDGERRLSEPERRPRERLAFDGRWLRHNLQPDCRVLLIGAGEVARYVAEFALAAEFSVTLCEPRQAFADGWSHGHIPLLRRLPDDLVAEAFQDRWCAVLALAHDPRVDDLGLMAALPSPAFYVGAMGSRVTTEARRAGCWRWAWHPRRWHG